jgi:fatty acid desaturase
VETQYTHYTDVDQVQLQKDIDSIRETIGDATQEDFDHLLKLERWGRYSTYLGFALIFLVVILDATSFELSNILFWFGGFAGAVLIATGNVGRWANVAHPILHGAYDKVPNIPYKYTKKGFAEGSNRYLDWLDWIKPDAWTYEHNIMHHYHLGEVDDPDNIEKNLKWLHDLKIPMFFKYSAVYIFALTWKLTYYAPNTLRILENKARAKKKLDPITHYEISPFKKNGLALWKDYILPYGIFQFVLLPALMLPFGVEAALFAFMFVVIAEVIANLWSFLVIVPNHSAEDIYQFSTPHKSQGEYYLRQIMGSVNYNTGTDLIDFCHGFLNYQVEHHLFPDKPHSFYQKMQPIVKDICKKHNLEYRQESVFKRIFMSIDLMVGKTKLLTIDGI